MNCTTLDNPCLTIQYVIDNVTMSGDVIKIDGSIGNFNVRHEVRISNCKNVTFTSYNGVAWIHRDRQARLRYMQYGRFLAIPHLKKLRKCEIHFNAINFRNTTLVQSGYSRIPQFIVTLKLTVKNCLFEFSGPRNSIGQALIIIKSQHSFIIIENCIIKANCEIAVIYYANSPPCTKSSSKHMIFRNTQIEEALYTVDAYQRFCTRALLEERSKLIITNSTVHSRGKCESRTAQFHLGGGMQRGFEVLLVVFMENSRFENLSVSTSTAAAMYIFAQSKVFIYNCTFKGNIGYRGGALLFRSTYLTIIDSHFYYNQARAISLCTLNYEDREGNGGAILIDNKVSIYSRKNDIKNL